ncbi:MAG: ribbon-helix-helix domain-containing protein [Alphaproteobacteria bacterium]|nr:ribbon-helix-helix domain-containing protein [Alphaproteobacteria bacterium]
MKKFSVLIANQHATSISLEEEFYQALLQLAQEQHMTANELITYIDETREIANLSSAIRIYILKALQQKINS